MMRRPGLSKSKITTFEQCPRRLWLQVHQPGLAELDGGAEARFAMGHAVGAAACALHPEGVMVEAVPDLAAALAKTAALLESRHPGPIFEATFEHDGVLVRVDVLRSIDGERWQLQEVKSSTSVKDYHLGDLATQVWVLESAGLPLASAQIAHVDNAFVLAEPGNYHGLFVYAELLDEARAAGRDRPDLVAEARRVLAGDEPVRDMGEHCEKPFSCEFATYCSQHLPPGPDWPVEILPYGGGKRWAAQGIDNLLDLDPAGLKPSEARIVAATRDDMPYHDIAGARQAMAGWPRPHTFLDFETIAPAVPLWVGTRPYEQVPFQFSAHVETREGELVHHAFLQVDGADPRAACAEALVRLLPVDGAIIAYNAGFERTVLRNLARAVPEHADSLNAMADRCVDLLPVAREHWYHRDQRGSWSIKAVLPTLSTEGYDGLEVKDGGEAQAAFMEAVAPDCDPLRRWALEEGLKAYCERDTMAMVMVMRRLQGDA